MSFKSFIAACAVSLTFALPALSQDHGKVDHGTMNHDATAGPKGDHGPSSQAFAEANAKMHAGMDIAFSGDTDIDFVRGMIPHHQGAIDMARILLEHGKNPELRKLAEEIIKAQEDEIKMMQDWLAKNGG